MKSSLGILALAVISISCGGNSPYTFQPRGTVACSMMALVTDCEPGTGTMATPVPETALVLTIQGNVELPPFSPYTIDASVRVLPGNWQTLGQNNQTAVTRTVTTTLTRSGECVPLDVKMVVKGSAPHPYKGTFYPETSGSKFEVCLEGDDVLVSFNADGNLLADDYSIKVSGNKPLRYEFQGDQLFVCVD